MFKTQTYQNFYSVGNWTGCWGTQLEGVEFASFANFNLSFGEQKLTTYLKFSF